jgi:hypothetical protein
MSTCTRVELGRHGSVPELKVVWEGRPIPRPITYTRTSSLVAYAELCGPDVTMNEAWHQIVSCALAGAAAAGIAAIVASPPTALGAFKTAFEACLVGKIAERAKEIRVALSTHQEPNGPWRRL